MAVNVFVVQVEADSLSRLFLPNTEQSARDADVHRAGLHNWTSPPQTQFLLMRLRCVGAHSGIYN
jgi:hypothetical protein